MLGAHLHNNVINLMFISKVQEGFYFRFVSKMKVLESERIVLFGKRKLITL